MIENPKFTYIDLFCGIGGSHLGLEANGGKCLFASDIDEHCQKVLNIFTFFREKN